MYFVDLFATHMCIGVAQKDFSLKPEEAQKSEAQEGGDVGFTAW